MVFNRSLTCSQRETVIYHALRGWCLFPMFLKEYAHYHASRTISAYYIMRGGCPFLVFCKTNILQIPRSGAQTSDREDFVSFTHAYPLRGADPLLWVCIACPLGSWFPSPPPPGEAAIARRWCWRLMLLSRELIPFLGAPTLREWSQRP